MLIGDEMSEFTLLENVQAGMVDRIARLSLLKRKGNLQESLVSVDVNLEEEAGRELICQQYDLSVNVNLTGVQFIVTAPYIPGSVCGNVGMYKSQQQCIADLIMRALIIGSQTNKI
jgi:hypothetical protein